MGGKMNGARRQDHSQNSCVESWSRLHPRILTMILDNIILSEYVV